MTKKITILSLIFFLPIIVFGANTEDSVYQQAQEWLQGSNILEDWFMEGFRGYIMENIKVFWDDYAFTAQILAGLMALMFFAGKAYEIMTGQSKFDILPLLRPFGILLLILNWTPFVNGISAPFESMTESASIKYSQAVGDLNDAKFERYKMQKEVIDLIYTRSAVVETAAEGAEKSFWDLDFVEDALEETYVTLRKLQLKTKITIQKFASDVLELAGLWILRGAVYAIFILQVCFTTVMAIVGPLSLAFSIFPMFKDSFSQWISRFISIQLYGFLAFVCLRVLSVVQQFAFEAEISRYKVILDNTAVSNNGILEMETQALDLFIDNGLFSFGMVFMMFIISAGVMFIIPTMSTWIISTGGAGMASGGFMRGAGMVMGKAGMAVKGLTGK